MALRATVRAVIELVETSLENDTVKFNMITTANIFINANLLSAGHSDDVLTQIEVYLSAHYLALAEERGSMIEEELSDSTDRMQPLYSAGLQSTRFGQQAVILDTSGILAALGSPKLKALFRVVGC